MFHNSLLWNARRSNFFHHHVHYRVFQRYTLLSYCFLHDHEYWYKSEQVWVQLPLLYPHNLSSTQRGLDAEKVAWEAYELALIVYNFVEHFKFWAIEDIMETPDPNDINLDGLSPYDYVKAVPRDNRPMH
ncbi:hypothetical protein M758_7G096100 [Ceratodon purpureus]|nr:hypothetical protein M758_7G096100 [Ceratodon purpureus]